MKRLRLFLLIALGLAALLYQQTNTLKTTYFSWQSKRVPSAFDGYRIVQVSDLHNKRFGKQQSRLLRAVRDARPDMIALTGDIIDRTSGNGKTLQAAEEFVQGAAGIAPLYYVEGNHEANALLYREFMDMLRRHGVTVLDGDVDTIERGGESMTLAGYSYWDFWFGRVEAAPADIVLYHSPDAFPQLAAQGCGLVLAGHIHGGQIALPGGKAVLSPGGGIFPRYSAGVYREGDAVMVLSRGLGTSQVPVRLFAPPELVVVEFMCE